MALAGAGTRRAVTTMPSVVVFSGRAEWFPTSPTVLRDELCAWLGRVGANPDDVRAFAVLLTPAAEFELHLTEYVRDEQGSMIVDWAMTECVTRPRVIALGSERT